MRLLVWTCLFVIVWAKNDCSSKKETGGCRAYFRRWYFDLETNGCKSFVYGGCGGNDNNYHSKRECEWKCSKKLCRILCPSYYRPVCGSNGRTYLNECMLRVARECRGQKDLKVANRGICGSNKKKGRDCSSKKETGVCRASFPRWYFDLETNGCKPFVYGGCGGNRNNYHSKRECEQKCAKKPCRIICHRLYQPVCGSNGQTYPNECMLRVARECRGQKDLKVANHGICGSNKKKGPDCSSKKEPGMCRAFFPRWYFDLETNGCKSFVYGGCGGNRNNYHSKGECEQKCAYMIRHNR